MIDGRTKGGKAAKIDKASMSARELAAAAAARRLGEVKPKPPEAPRAVEVIDLCSDEDEGREDEDGDYEEEVS